MSLTSAYIAKSKYKYAENEITDYNQMVKNLKMLSNVSLRMYVTLLGCKYFLFSMHDLNILELIVKG